MRRREYKYITTIKQHKNKTAHRKRKYVRKYRPPAPEEIIEVLKPWLKGFIHKEYGTHTNPDDRADLEQEGYLSLLNFLQKINKHPPRFVSEEEFYLYVRAVVRNAIRDYILKFRSRFGISLFKLRKELKGEILNNDNDSKDKIEKRLGDFMNSVGEEYVYSSQPPEEDFIDYAIKQRRLDLLSQARNRQDLNLEQSRNLLFEIINEYKTTEQVKVPFEAPISPSLPLEYIPQSTDDDCNTNIILRTPIPGRRTPKKCANRLCQNELKPTKTIIERGFGYCSKRCKKLWPPIINRLQSSYNTPIEIILIISLKLFRSKKRAAEILEISTTTFDKLIRRFQIEQ